MIEVENLTKYYGDILGIEDVSFKIEPGEIVGFLGPNGSGKTTTMRILTTYMPPTRGSARVAGFDVQEDSLEVRKRIGYLPEQPPLYHDMDVAGYLKFVARIKGVPKKDIPERLERVMSWLGLEDMQDRQIRKLSKGYRQRTGLAQAIIHDPPILILDEPTIGLDPHQNAEMRNLIKSLAGDHTIILSTHILPEVTLTCQRAVIIHRGRIMIDDSLENLTQERDLEQVFLRLIGQDEAEQQKQAQEGGTEVPT
jgi:ABC-2 type transport system ATP-binding protein